MQIENTWTEDKNGVMEFKYENGLIEIMDSSNTNLYTSGYVKEEEIREYTLSQIKQIQKEGNYYDLKWNENESDGVIEFEFNEPERFIVIPDPSQSLENVKFYDILTKTVKAQGNSSSVILPKTWVGKRVKVLLIEPLD